MKTYTTTETANVSAGTKLQLTPKQAAARSSGLKALGGDLYLATTAQQFKAGETLGIEGDLGKGTVALVDPAELARQKKERDDKEARMLSEARERGRADRDQELLPVVTEMLRLLPEKHRAVFGEQLAALGLK